MFKCPICLADTAHEDRKEFQLSEEGTEYAVCPFCHKLIIALRNSEKVTKLPHSQKLIQSWNDLPANAQTVAVVESCISYLQDHHPYPANMKIDRTAFAGSRVAYAAAIYHLERFMAELTEEIKLKEMADEEEAIPCA